MLHRRAMVVEVVATEAAVDTIAEAEAEAADTIAVVAVGTPAAEVVVDIPVVEAVGTRAAEAGGTPEVIARTSSTAGVVVSSK